MESNRDDVFVVNKGKRSKRPRSLSPAAALLLHHLPPLTPSSSNSGEVTDEDFEEDMANCLILLANGNHHHHRYDYSQWHRQTSSSSSPPEIYKCKTCSKTFPSFQALGGHRTSHKNKPNKLPATPLIDHDHKTYNKPKKSEDFRSIIPDETTNLSLQISSRSSFSSGGGSSSGGQSSKPRVHECSICGAEFASGQALGGHMRRHRPILSAAAVVPATSHDHSPELKRPKSALPLDLNLPAPEDDDRLESKAIPFSPKEQVILFSAPSLVDCHF